MTEIQGWIIIGLLVANLAVLVHIEWDIGGIRRLVNATLSR
jgi:hypothetical protein